MCGIVGLITSLELADSYTSRLQAMTDALRHRGPDDAGLEVVHSGHPAAIFGHRRLAIIDLSSAGHQPMCDPNTGNWITFNGEIYNYRELRQVLERQGQIFCTQTDTEVILKAYAVWGEACVRRLQGIFSFGIWNQRTRLLFLARDHLGIKPLYYWQDDSTLIFASEVRALLASGLVPRHLDPYGLRSYLAYGSVQEPLTLVQGVRSLLPGHALSWQGSRVQIKRYWQLPGPEQVSLNVAGDVYQQIRELLTEAVRMQLISDVPLGAFLSGGIDSTAIVALAQRVSSQPIKTFSIVFDETAYDERVYSRLAADQIGTEHTELMLTGESVLNALPQAIKAFDQPSMDGVNTYLVSKLTREAGLTVALSGVGGDELFGGYSGYRRAILAERWATRMAGFPSCLRSLISHVIRTLAIRESFRKAAALIDSPRNPYFITRQVFARWQISDILETDIFLASENWETQLPVYITDEVCGYDVVNRVSALELQTYMLSTLLRDTDQMSMAHALEVRVPLLDYTIVEYLFSLPGTSKLDSYQPKPLLTRSLSAEIPDECVHRPKRGFELPFAVWLKKNLRTEIRNCFFSRSDHPVSIFKMKGLEKTWEQFEGNRLGWSRIWGLYVLLKWLDQHKVTAEF